ncbi:MAG: hypothetical protein LBP76_06070, partial [Treponema sp.]|nr:hypothetical protein [Treponema sp.]
DLHHQHRGESLKRVFEKSLGYKGEESVKVYVDILARANIEGMKEITEMARETLEEVLTAAGLTAIWEARGRSEGEARGRMEGRVEGEARGEAKGMKEALEMLRSGRSLEELERIYQERERRLTKTRNG